MKKTLLVLLLLIPFFVYADEACPVEIDNSTELNRTLTCDNKNMKATIFKTAKASGETVLKNDVCTITCTEEITFSINPMQKVLAGMSFNYPLYVSGERICSAAYNYANYETSIKKLVADYSSLTGDAKATKGRELTNYYAQKKECDEFTKDGSDYEKKYKLDADVDFTLETSEKTVPISYIYKEISNYNSRVNKDDVLNYESCNYNETNKTCEGSESTIEKWTETVRIFGKYTMPDTYIESYTGEALSKANTTGKKVCNAGDRYFTSFTELTKPREGDTKDNGYKLTLIAKKIGNNLISNGEEWNLTVNCSYKVNNLFSPQGGSVSGKEDDNYDEYGNQAYVYRTIDLENPFLNRTPGANWQGIKIENIIKNKETTLNSEKFVINMTPSNIKAVIDYNSTNNYNAFSFDYKNGKEFSYFIEKFKFINRK